MGNNMVPNKHFLYM